MISFVLRALAPLLVMFSCARAAVSLPLQDGERLAYRVSWAIVPGAGEIKIAAQVDPAAKDRLVVTTTTATRRLARVLLPFNAEAKSTFDLTSGRLLSLRETSSTKGKNAEHEVTFNYADRSALYVVPGGVVPPKTLPMPEGSPVDLIMALLQTRSWDLKPGESRDALVLFKDEFYELTIHMARYEKLRTSMGTFDTTVLEPRMDKTPPKGMFKRGSSVRVWIAQDAHRLPVKFEVEFNIGTGTATLESYQSSSATGNNATGTNPPPPASR